MKTILVISLLKMHFRPEQKEYVPYIFAVIVVLFLYKVYKDFISKK